MYYLKIEYNKTFGIPCQTQYIEIDDDLYATKSIEIHWNGDIGYATEQHPDGTNGAVLPERQLPTKEAIENLSKENEYMATVIDKEIFDSVWIKATTEN